MSDMTSTPEEVAVPLQDRRGLGEYVNDGIQYLIDRAVSSPIGFITAAAALLIAGSVGFLIATIVMPFWMYRRKKYLGAFGALILLACIVVAVFAPWIQTTDVGNSGAAPYAKASFSDRLIGPTWDHVLGTDNLGRDYVTRIVYGAEVTVLVGIGTVLLTAFLATVVGLVSGYFAGAAPRWTMYAPEPLLNLPGPVWWVASLPFALVALLVLIVVRLVDIVTLYAFHSQIEAKVDEVTSQFPMRTAPAPDLDLTIQRVVDIWQAFPAIFLILGILAVLGSGGTGFLGLGRGPNFGPQAQIGDEWLWEVFPRTTVVIVTLAVVIAAGNSRIVRGAVLATRASQYIEAARALGATNSRIMIAHIVPNVMATIIILSSINLGVAVLAEAAISFLGFGIPPPFPTWGRDSSGLALTYGSQYWWMAVFPGLAIAIAVFGFNMMGDALRDILDPRLRGT